MKADERARDGKEDLQLLLHDARRKLESVRNLPPEEVTHGVDIAEKRIVALRDALISRVRRKSSDTAVTMDALGQVNIALSLVVAVEYPLEGIQRKSIDEADKVLEKVMLG